MLEKRQNVCKFCGAWLVIFIFMGFEMLKKRCHLMCDVTQKVVKNDARVNAIFCHFDRN